MGDAEQLIVKIVHRMADIDAAAWDACANPESASIGGDSAPTGDSAYDPFLSHAFLSALEESGSASPQTGWTPHHLIMEDAEGISLGCVLMYLKSHSRGEYVFDHGWADAFERAGGHYYPKLQISIPFTPATGRRLLARPGPAMELIEDHLLAAVIEVAQRAKISSAHFTFLTERQAARLGTHGLLLRTDQQFHWQNRGYGSFDDFLNDLASRKRKNLKKERQRALENGIEIDWLTGDSLTEDHWDAFFRFYLDTGGRKWGTPYLTRKFFSLINETMADDILLIMAKRGGRYIAGALNFIGSQTLFGRNWGALEDHPFLHFECCYYQAIDFAISRGLSRVEAGAQGPHKLARGYLPMKTCSAHYIANPAFREAVEDYLQRERAYVDRDIAILSDHSPFRRNPDSDQD